MTSDKQLKEAVRAYAAEHGVSYTAARRAVLDAQLASTDDAAAACPYPGPDVLLLDPMTGCWRSWRDAVVDVPEPDVADDGEWLYGQIAIGRETFSNPGGMLQLVRGDAVAYWMRDKKAVVGSVHRDGQHCLVCHDRYEYGAPDTLGLLEHRAHQVQAAFERRAGLGMGTSMRVTCEGDAGRLVATLELTDAVPDTRLRGFEWRSDYGWTSVLSSAEEAHRVVEKPTLLGWDTWQPHRVADEIERAARSAT